MPSKISDQQLLDDLRRVDEISDKNVTQDVYNKLGEYSYKTCSNRFGSWNEALREAGIEPVKGFNIDRQKVLKDIEKVAENNGGKISSDDYKSHGEFGLSTVQRKFGSWLSACEEAGVERKRRSTASDADEITRADRVELVDDEFATEDRRIAAEYIQELWPTTLTKIAEESGYSRQHIKNTLNKHFAKVGSGSINRESSVAGVMIEGERYVSQSYAEGFREGYRKGYLDGKSDSEE